MEPQQPNANSGLPPNQPNGSGKSSQPNTGASAGLGPDPATPAPSTSGMPASPIPPQPPSGKKSIKGFLIGFVILVVALAIAAAAVAGNKSSDKEKGANNNGGSSQSQDDSSEDVYTGANGEFTVLKPQAGWKEDELGDVGLVEGSKGVIYVPENLAETDQYHSVIAFYVFPMEEGMTIDSTLAQGKAVYTGFPEFQELKSEKKKHNGKDAFRYEVKYKLGDMLVHQFQDAVLHNNKLYSVSTTLPDAEWEANKAMVETMHNSFKVK